MSELDNKKDKSKDSNKKPKKPGAFSIGNIIIFVIVALLLIWVVFAFLPNNPGTNKSFDGFLKDLQDAARLGDDTIFFRNISFDVVLSRFNVTFVNGATTSSYFVNYPSSVAFQNLQIPGTTFTGLELATLAIANTSASGIGTLNFSGLVTPTNQALAILLSLIPTFLFVGIIFFVYKMQSKANGGMGGFNPGKNQAERIYTKIKFSDIAGNEEVKEEVAELVDYLKNPKKYSASGARIPRGILLGGPPGTGKTLLAKATAGEANVPFYFISGSNFVELFVGVGAKRVRELFKEARKSSPAIIFIDELDAVGRSRGAGIGGGNDEREQTLNQLLVEMDGMTENSGLLVMAATNRTDVLDPALLRPGRFDRTVTVGLPNVKDREAILKLHAKGKRISSEVSFQQLAKRTPGYSGAQLENVINEASLLSVREDTKIITLEQFDEAIDRVMSGPAKKSRVITKEELTAVAYHEAGHAVVGTQLRKGVKVQKITIIPRGSAGGYNLMIPEEEKYNSSKSELIAMITSFMGGRAAEQIIYGEKEVSTGARDDIKKATSIARKMVTEWGMSDLGPIMYEEDTSNPFLGRDYTKNQLFSDHIAREIDTEVRKIILTAEQKAIEVIQENREMLELIKEALLENETIVDEEIQYIAKNLKLPSMRTKAKSENVNQIRNVDELVKEVKDQTLIIKDKNDKKIKDSENNIKTDESLDIK
ncbi:ATP-dependent zinc metalloprotease FtsH [[Mycoplasma] mobile]|uniref:ATP-dependent zinc metalloprotease FtsH n=1 Tax=Mycoplasma mobile (strain ATCC 43663 / 163K / NCTC 11711) TaxID=267748 RepID=FTSH_MYCM1|nr:ATP-dependent zinc metalloprotease FtsH [[Mycoplasma] mobile]Q6KHA4.1 RecName: Full=ATP-dependent zinc metalloprotease FtsH [Mycoplasma mobile 163K]AAT28026.1 cell division protein ftsH [Mycoplasma mobile 163K]